MSHELGDHNMKENYHSKDSQGNVIYPSYVTIEGNVPGNIRTTQSDVKTILEKNVRSIEVTPKNLYFAAKRIPSQIPMNDQPPE